MMTNKEITALLDDVSKIVNDHYNNLTHKNRGIKLIFEKFTASVTCTLNLATVILKHKDLNMNISTNGVNLLIINEGKKLTPYLCSRGVPTIGIGCTTYQDGRKVTLKDRPITEKECMDLFNHHMSRVVNWINTNCKWVNQNQFDVLCSFLHQYNIDKYPNTKKAFISGNLVEIRRILDKDFNHADVSKKDGTLKARRQRELALFNKAN